MKIMVLSRSEAIRGWFNDFKDFRITAVKKERRKARKALLSRRNAEAIVEESKRKREDSIADRRPASSAVVPSAANVSKNEGGGDCATQPTPKKKPAAKTLPRKNPPRPGKK